MFLFKRKSEAKIGKETTTNKCESQKIYVVFSILYKNSFIFKTLIKQILGFNWSLSL